MKKPNSKEIKQLATPANDSIWRLVKFYEVDGVPELARVQVEKTSHLDQVRGCLLIDSPNISLVPFSSECLWHEDDNSFIYNPGICSYCQNTRSSDNRKVCLTGVRTYTQPFDKPGLWLKLSGYSNKPGKGFKDPFIKKDAVYSVQDSTSDKPLSLEGFNHVVLTISGIWYAFYYQANNAVYKIEISVNPNGENVNYTVEKAYNFSVA